MFLSTCHLLFLYQNKMPYQAIPSSLFLDQRSNFFHWQGIETKINLVAPRRQTVLRNSPTRPATLCARPRDMQIANWKARTHSLLEVEDSQKKGRYCPDTQRIINQTGQGPKKVIV
ncbi:hypothetical protein AVEN_245855-1 [Araneus ventricosus]|uniref:Uncharacterized protein n=1 Tax=Araneus ventricosus TaxID=182803 RepID=A0A4Y2MFJ7_ARAVE|nr:hypothetical protein AVEN_245855-1 [Araneus ventricosus]